MRANSLSLPLLSTSLLLLGLYPLDGFWCAWLAWIPLFIMTETLSAKPSSGIQARPAGSRAARRVFALIFLTFFIYYGVWNYWLLCYQLPLFLASALAAAAIVTLYFWFYHLLTRKSRSTAFKLPCAFVLWPLLQRGVRLTPVTTALFEAPFDGPLEFFQIASIADYGFFGGLILALSLSIALCAGERRLKNALGIVLLSACLAGLYGWGHHRLRDSGVSKPKAGFKAALIQHNIPIAGEWRSDHPDEIRDRYKRLAREAAASKPDLIIFPLYDFPEDPLREPAFFSVLAGETGAHILVASHVPEIPGKSILDHGYRNVAVLYAPSGKMLGSYQSVEKAPSFSPVKEHGAREYKVLDSPFGKMGILLCYEDARPTLAKKASGQGARFLIALSNPGFFSKTHMPYYHLLQDRLRAIETGLPLLRVSANGYSAEVDPRGRFIRKSDLEKEEILFATV